MTLTVTIKNHSGTLNAIIELCDISDGGVLSRAEGRMLPPGESVDVVLHKHRELRVQEEGAVTELRLPAGYAEKLEHRGDVARAFDFVDKAFDHAHAASIAAAGDDEASATAHSQAACAASSAVTALAQATQLRR